MEADAEGEEAGRRAVGVPLVCHGNDSHQEESRADELDENGATVKSV